MIAPNVMQHIVAQYAVNAVFFFAFVAFWESLNYLIVQSVDHS
jgi:hypothetical protein